MTGQEIHFFTPKSCFSFFWISDFSHFPVCFFSLQARGHSLASLHSFLATFALEVLVLVISFGVSFSFSNDFPKILVDVLALWRSGNVYQVVPTIQWLRFCFLWASSGTGSRILVTITPPTAIDFSLISISWSSALRLCRLSAGGGVPSTPVPTHTTLSK